MEFTIPANLPKLIGSMYRQINILILFKCINWFSMLFVEVWIGCALKIGQYRLKANGTQHAKCKYIYIFSLSFTHVFALLLNSVVKQKYFS